MHANHCFTKFTQIPVLINMQLEKSIYKITIMQLYSYIDFIGVSITPADTETRKILNGQIIQNTLIEQSVVFVTIYRTNTVIANIIIHMWNITITINETHNHNS